jgi:WhiB family redox-sensing transcriptional regulator
MLFKNTPSCLGLEIDLFFTPDDENSNYLHLDQVKRMCAACPAKDECFDYAIEYAVFGLWAGTTKNERDAYRNKHGIEGKGLVPYSLFKDQVWYLEDTEKD